MFDKLVHSAFLVVKKTTTEHIHRHSSLACTLTPPHLPSTIHYGAARLAPLMYAFTTRRTQKDYKRTIIDGGKKTYEKESCC